MPTFFFFLTTAVHFHGNYRNSAANGRRSRCDSPLLLHLHLLLLVILLAGCSGVGAKAVVELDYEDASGLAEIILVKEGAWYEGQGVSYTDGAIWLTPNPLNADPKVNGSIGNIGRMVYKDPFDLDSETSFTTSFKFQIVTNATNSGSGMAFFLSTSMEAPPLSQGGALGLTTYQNTSDLNLTILTPPYPFFAVEFDTSLSPLFRDPSNSHVGIDLNSLISSNVTDTNNSSALNLYNNLTFTSWIDYDAQFHLIRVWLASTNDTSAALSRPASPLLQLSHDISTLFNASVYAGFTSANRFAYGNLEGAAIYSWKLLVRRPSESNVALIVGLTVAVVVAAAAAAGGGGYWLYRGRRRRREEEERLGVVSVRRRQLAAAAGSKGLPQRCSYREIRKAAGRFKEENKIGEGGCSTVYLAKLGGEMYAVKRLKDSVKKEEEFMSEIEIISSLRHRNLLSLEGWCYEKGEALLLYKYLSHGSLDQYIHGHKKGTLPSDTKWTILEGVALGLEYLHTGLGHCVLHRDIKPENVLLSDTFHPLLSDFGLARLISHNQEVTLTAVGTPGYVAPELVYSGRGTEKADVYSFGVLSLVVASGRRPIDPSLPPPQMRLLDWLWQLHLSQSLHLAFDPSISPPSHAWLCLLHLALLCCNPHPDSRPSMRHVIQVLEDKTLLPLPSAAPSYPLLTSLDAPRYPTSGGDGDDDDSQTSMSLHHGGLSTSSDTNLYHP